jgi:glycosyltransferase involved in cell wall biosynthesis
MKMTVLNVAYPLAPVDRDAVGGAEQILSYLDVALTHAGHQSIVIAQEGSKVTGTLKATPRVNGELSAEKQRWAQHQHQIMIEEALGQWPIDVIHLHGVDFYKYLPPASVPALITLHLPPSWYPSEVFSLERPSTFLHCVSKNQSRFCPPCDNLLPEIENGIPAEDMPGHHAKRRFVMALGRVCPEKGFHIAIDAASRAQIPLIIAGKVFPYLAHECYFQREIHPRLGRLHRFIGPAGFRRKCRLLSAARCLLVPSLVPETSSLVAMEALACGTPVIAFPSGALADIVEDGKTCFLVRNEQEMADAILAADTLSSEACREAARTRFSLARMTEQYLELYEQLALKTVVPGKTATQPWKEALPCAV